MQGGARVFADRFDVEAFAGAGGMGDVFRARDRLTGARVALKVPRSGGARERERFLREASSLAELRHDGIVGYVAHGEDAAGELFLAMEWIGGEGLDVYLRHAKVSAEQTIRLGLRLADAIATAHRRGIVHRDLKPANVMLVEGDLERPKVLDFGLARLLDVARSLTRSGVAVGTPAYMAPEQASANRQVDARADVFSLGCILFECVAGRPAFQGEQVAAILLKVLYDVPPRLRDLAPDVPAGLDELVARMLAKAAHDRPESMAVVRDELDLLDTSEPTTTAVRVRRAASSVSPSEQRLTGLVLVAPPATGEDARLATTLALDAVAAWLPAVREAAARHGGSAFALADGTAVVTLTVADSASDLATRACRCALAIRRALPSAFVSVAMGRCELGSRPGASAIIERAARPLTSLPSIRPPGDGAPLDAAARAPIWVDEVTAGLLDARFDATARVDGAELHAERPFLDAPRPLGGRSSTFVGRERERSSVRELYEEVAAEGVARVALVTAPPGLGKTRLAFELGRELAASRTPAQLLFARGYPATAGAPYALLRSLLASFAGFREGDSRTLRRSKLEARLAHASEPSVGSGLLAPLGEAIGLGETKARVFAEIGGDEAQTARDAVTRAFVALLRAETEAQPLVLCLEDLHWGDAASLRLVDVALQRLAGRPLFVLGLARPEVARTFPGLFGARDVLEIRLAPLARRHAERLVRVLVGEDAPAAVVAALVDAGGGNPYFLEELARGHARGESGRAPATLLAAVQARLERLAPEARRVLRAASVFGVRFRASGVAALLAGEVDDLDAWFEQLVADEILEAEDEAGREYFAFAQSLLRDAAYAMLTDDDRVHAHRQAAEWLGRSGSAPPPVLVRHLELAGRVAEAVPLHARAAEDACLAADGRAAIEHAERALALGATGELAATCWSVLLRTHLAHGDVDAAERAGARAIGLAAPASAAWIAASFDLASVALAKDDRDALDAHLDALLAATPHEAARLLFVRCLAKAAAFAILRGDHATAERALGRVADEGDGLADPRVTGHVAFARAQHAELLRSAPWSQLRSSDAAAEHLGRAREWLYVPFARAQEAWARIVLGAPVGTLLKDAKREAEERDVGIALPLLDAYAAFAEALTGDVPRARRALAEALDACTSPVVRARVALLVARAALLDGDAEGAERAVAGALAHPVRSAGDAGAIALAAAASLHAGRPDEALRRAAPALALLRGRGGCGHEEALLLVTVVDALAATGALDEARRRLVEARARLERRADAAPDAASRAAFLASLPEHVRTMTHALAPSAADGRAVARA